MTRREIRENIFKLVFCGEFHTSDELPGTGGCVFRGTSGGNGEKNMRI